MFAATVPATAIAAPAAPSAAPAPERWININQRQANLERRINVGVRNGSLTRAEAANLRRVFGNLERLEQRYRRSGNRLTRAERLDLDQRFDRLSRMIRAERHDAQTRRDHDRRGYQNNRR
ncbi:hypothetical protein G5C33_16025 [Sphingosinithalassobacter tenebrarum]|uniref:Uncharacterized protein n=2 Tax=Stakelama tenebrarum TaxID=2711215 RepID=A0A6G6YBB4_9SPHN|nr:hypothetical protein G5C33_16025 [Sphingosinithalassobacter tenebrarum]